MVEVRFVNVTKLYGRKLAINNISFDVKEGEFFSILGPTGAGKTTILKMIAGIEPITSGKILFNNAIVNNMPPYERNVSMAFETYNLYSHFSVYENIAFPLRAPKWKLNLSKEEERKRVVEIASFLGIEKLLDRRPQALSGGQKQRVSLARALVRRPQVYLLDEPIAHLDAKLKFSTQTLLREFAVNYKSTIIYVTHDYREALALSDRIMILRKGAIEQIDTPENIYYTPKTDFTGRLVGEPPMNMIDGEIVKEANNSLFKVGSYFTISLQKELTEAAEKVAKLKNDKLNVRLGIRCEDIKIGMNKLSENSFQLPVYAIVHEAESFIISFELENTILQVRTEEDGELEKLRISDLVWLDFVPEKIFFYENTMEISKS
ncbi:MAG: ABC transporter ATP-binding protein [Actinobacteria bacterium]|nr:ABC transporter ATP-binding protein [Cyanobacteriota bacterium]MCL6087125.1 ABC transporter ATP-binding protein [Actinomycetota bacterium]